MDELVSSNDRLTLYGMGLFETMLLAKQTPLFPQLHWQRMRQGAALLGLPFPPLESWLREIQADIAQTENTPEIRALRVTLSGGSPQHQQLPRLLCQIRPLAYTREHYERGFALSFLSHPLNETSPLRQIKSTNYLENLLARQQAQARGADEGLWLNTQGYLAEGTISNLFFVHQGKLHTPSLECGCLPGTRRALVLQLAKHLNIPACEDQYRPADLFQADEIFLTNALMGLMPVSRLESQARSIPEPDARNSIFRRLEQAFQSELVLNISHPTLQRFEE